MIKYNNDLKIAFKKSEFETQKLKVNFLESEHFILGILSFDNNAKNILNKYNITYENFKAKLLTNKYNSFYYGLTFKKIINIAIDNLPNFNTNELTIEGILLTILEEENGTCMSILKEYNINLNLLINDLLKYITTSKDLLILSIGIDLNEMAKENKLNEVIGREKETNELIEILARKNKNNPILIGKAGVGKTAIVESLAVKIINGKVPNFLKNKKIILLNMASIISGTKYRGEFEEKLNKIIRETSENENIIIFIDEIHTIIGAGGAEGAIDASNILKPYLARNTIKIIGSTTLEEYKKHIESDKAFNRRVQKVYIEEPSVEDTINILMKVKSEYEKFHNVTIKDELIKTIVNLAKKNIFDRCEPDRSLDILDEACAKTSINSSKEYNNLTKINIIKSEKELAIRNNDFIKAKKLKAKEKAQALKYNNRIYEVNEETIINIIKSKCNSSNIKYNYKSINKKLKKMILNQNIAIDKFIKIMEINENKINDNLISILFFGNKGTGKYLLLNEYSKIKKQNIITIDMMEYLNEISVNKIMGSSQGYVGYNDTNTTFEEVKLNPKSIIVIKNFSKGHKFVKNIITNIIKTNTLKLSNNETIKFNNCVFVFIENNIKNNKIGYIDINCKENFLLYNNVNYKIEFNDLNEVNIRKIITNKYKEIKLEYNLNNNLNRKAITDILNKTEYKINGASKINSILNDYITSILISI